MLIFELLTMKTSILVTITTILMASCTAEKDYLITFHTSYGDMHAILYDATPRHKKNFLELAQSGRYDSTLFHRVIDGFMIQGGDLTTKPSPGPGDTIEYTVPAEFSDTLYHRKGALAAARQGDRRNPERASSGSQFYVVQGVVYTEDKLLTDMDKLTKGVQQLVQFVDYTDEGQALIDLYESGDYDGYTKKMLELKPAVEKKLDISVDRDYPEEKLHAYTTVGGVPHLDDTYTVFGQVLDNLAVIDSIAIQPTNAERPLNDIYLTVSVEELPKKKITQRFGYVYPSN